jgi:hypothetical protein
MEQELLTLTDHRGSSLFYACLTWVGDGQFVELHVFMFLVPGKKRCSVRLVNIEQHEPH